MAALSYGGHESGLRRAITRLEGHFKASSVQFARYASIKHALNEFQLLGNLSPDSLAELVPGTISFP